MYSPRATRGFRGPDNPRRRPASFCYFLFFSLFVHLSYSSIYFISQITTRPLIRPLLLPLSPSLSLLFFLSFFSFFFNPETCSLFYVFSLRALELKFPIDLVSSSFRLCCSLFLPGARRRSSGCFELVRTVFLLCVVGASFLRGVRRSL